MSEMSKPLIEILDHPQSALHHDLGSHLIKELHSLLMRHTSIMATSDLGPNGAFSLVLSALIVAGLSIERDSGAPSGTFLEMTKALEKVKAEVKQDGP